MFHLLLYGPQDPPKYVKFVPEVFHGVLFDEISLGKLLKNVLSENVNGVVVSKRSLQDVIRELCEKEIYVLHEKGLPIEEIEFGKDVVFVLGDHIGLPKKDEKFVMRYAKCKVSIGKLSYFTSHVITIINYILDKRGVP